MGFNELPMAVVPQLVLTGGIKEFKPSFTASLADIVYGLTKWVTNAKPCIVEPRPRTFVFESASYQQAVDKMNALFLEKDWGDGLPLTPPTRERVDWLLTGTALDRDEAIGMVKPRGGQLTVEALAINAAMAGAVPKHMPVIITAMQIMTMPEFDLEALQGTTNPVAPLIIVNGPIAREIGINSGFGLLGPNPRFPAGAAIGRAIRSILTTVGGAVPGVTDMATHGQPGKYTGLVIAEAEDLSPWEPLSVEQGFAPGANTVTAYGVMSVTNYPGLSAEGQFEKFMEGLASKYIAVPSINYCYHYLWNPQNETRHAGVLLIPPVIARFMAENGWSKKKVKDFLHDKARITLAEYVSYVSWPQFGRIVPAAGHENEPPETMVPITRSADDYILVVAGGDLALHWQWLPVGHGGATAITKEIRLPPNWRQVLAK